MALRNTSKRYGNMGLVRSIAARLGRFHNWSFPSSSDTHRATSQWVGQYGELAAASWCNANGWKILRRNWKLGEGGEIDLVCRDGDCLVFAEVKTRTSAEYGNPVRAVDRKKRDLIRSGAHLWLHMLEQEQPPNYRYDVFEILLEEGLAPSVNHIPYAFGESRVRHNKPT